MRKVIAKRDTWVLDKGHEYFVKESDFCGGCWHIYAFDTDKDSHIFNIFSKAEFDEYFEEVAV